MQAIKNNGIDYVLKPFKETEIHQALNKYKNLKASLQSKDVQPLQIENPTQQSYQKTFLTQYREKSLVKRIEDVAIFYVELENVYMHTTSNEKCPLFKKMEYIESVCDPNQFFRVNRQMLVHRDAIISFEPYFNRKIVLQLNVNFKEQIIVSRLKVTAFKEWLER